jgi:hypothetical protein
MLVDTHVPTNAFPSAIAAGLVAAASSNIEAGVVTCLATFVKRTIEHTLSSSSSKGESYKLTMATNNTSSLSQETTDFV